MLVAISLGWGPGGTSWREAFVQNSMRRSLTCLVVVALAALPATWMDGPAAAKADDTSLEDSQRATASAAAALGWSPIAGPYLAATPQVLPPEDALFLLDLDTSAYVHVPDNGVWSDPIPLGGFFKSVVVPALALNPLPFVEIFGTGADDAMWYRTDSTDWQSLGGLFIFDPVAVTVQGVTYVFGVGQDHALWYRSIASGWISLGGYLTSTPEASTDGQNLYISGVGRDDALWTRQLSPSLTWSPWLGHGGIVTSYAASAFLDNAGYVFVIGADDAVWYLRVSGGAWSGWQSLGGIAISAPAATADFDGGVDVFIVGQDSAMYQQRLTSSGWSGWRGLGGLFISAPGASFSQVYGIGVDSNLWGADYL